MRMTRPGIPETVSVYKVENRALTQRELPSERIAGHRNRRPSYRRSPVPAHLRQAAMDDRYSDVSQHANLGSIDLKGAPVPRRDLELGGTREDVPVGN